MSDKTERRGRKKWFIELTQAQLTIVAGGLLQKHKQVHLVLQRKKRKLLVELGKPLLTIGEKCQIEFIIKKRDLMLDNNKH